MKEEGASEQAERLGEALSVPGVSASGPSSFSISGIHPLPPQCLPSATLEYRKLWTKERWRLKYLQGLSREQNLAMLQRRVRNLVLAAKNLDDEHLIEVERYVKKRTLSRLLEWIYEEEAPVIEWTRVQIEDRYVYIGKKASEG